VRKVTGWTFVCTALFCLFTLPYVLPSNLLSDLFVKTNKIYDHVFAQKWTLFSPNPVIFKYDIWLKCGFLKNQYSAWFYPAVHADRMYHHNRFGIFTKLRFVNISLIDGIIDDLFSEKDSLVDAPLNRKSSDQFREAKKTFDQLSVFQKTRLAYYAQQSCEYMYPKNTPILNAHVRFLVHDVLKMGDTGPKKFKQYDFCKFLFVQ